MDVDEHTEDDDDSDDDPADAAAAEISDLVLCLLTPVTASLNVAPTPLAPSKFFVSFI